MIAITSMHDARATNSMRSNTMVMEALMSRYARPRSPRALADGGWLLSRRRFIAVCGAAVGTAGLGWRPARAQEGIWREYRRDDLSFRVELPGDPKIEVSEGEAGDEVVRTTDVQLDYGETLFGINCDEWKGPVSARRVFVSFREGMRLSGIPATGENDLSIKGFPAREFVRESDDLNFIHRFVVAGTLVISVTAYGGRTIHGDPLVRRFIDSFKLLRTAP